MTHDYQFKKDYLIHYLSTYLSKKHIQMKDFMTNVQNQILSNRPITLLQFHVLLKYLMKEAPFKSTTEETVIKFFSEFISNTKSKSQPQKETHYEQSDLTKFIQ